MAELAGDREGDGRLFIRGFYGTWTCQWCGTRWAGRWNGPKELITCLLCQQRLYDDDGKRVEPDLEWVDAPMDLSEE